MLENLGNGLWQNTITLQDIDIIFQISISCRNLLFCNSPYFFIAITLIYSKYKQKSFHLIIQNKNPQNICKLFV